MARTIHNSIIVRVNHEYPTVDWIALITDLYSHTVKQAQGEVATVPGPVSGQVDWLFESESDAAWFVLRHNGKVVSADDPGVGAVFAGFLG